jgi:hypothetical protein
MTDKTGGAAFPCEQGHTPEGFWNDSFDPGMTLRDYFAAKAMQGVLAMGPETVDGRKLQHPKDSNVIAVIAYALADAMLAERAK